MADIDHEAQVLTPKILSEEINKIYTAMDSLRAIMAEQIQLSNSQIHNTQELFKQLVTDVETLAVSVENRIVQFDQRLNKISEDLALMRRVESAYSAKLVNLEKELDRHFLMFDEHISEYRMAVLKDKKEFDSLRGLLRQYDQALANHTIALTETETNLTSVRHNASAALENIQQTISRQTLIWIIMILLITVLMLSLFLVLRIRLNASAASLDRQIRKTAAFIDAEAIKMDSKLIEFLEKQLALSATAQMYPVPGASEDHGLALKTGLEIHRMRKRMENMPEGTKGVGALRQSLDRLEEEFNTAGYQLVPLLGKPYSDGLTVHARFTESDTLAPGEQIITKVIKPQINYQGTLINTAEVEVSTGA